MNTLLFGCSYLGDLDAVMKLDLWLKCARMQDVSEVLVVDTYHSRHHDLMLAHMRQSNERIFPFYDNIGHGSRNGDMDGWGRAFCFGIEYAIQHDFDWAVHMECDLLSRVNVQDVIRYLESKDKPFGAPWCSQVNNVETGLMYMSVKRLREIDFINRYDWQKIRPEMSIADRIARQPEKVIGKIFGDECERLDMVGWRWENQEQPNEYGMYVPGITKLSYLTHCRAAWFDLYSRDSRGNMLPLLRWPT